MTFGLSAAAIGGIAAGAGAVGGALITSSGAQSAADTQASAANNSAALQNQQYQQTAANLSPYVNLGRSAINPLINALGYNATQDSAGQYQFSKDPNSPLQQQFQYGQFNAPTAEQAQSTPGYQFTLDQGLQATQNSAAARGLGASGAALKGAAGYATGLANSTYNDVYNRALSSYNSNFNTASSQFQTNYNTAANNANRLQGVVSNGQNAANQTGTLGAATAANIGNTLQGGAQANASGAVASANAYSGALNSIGSNALTYGMLQNNASNSLTSASGMGAANSGASLGGINGIY